MRFFEFSFVLMLMRRYLLIEDIRRLLCRGHNPASKPTYLKSKLYTKQMLHSYKMHSYLFTYLVQRISQFKPKFKVFLNVL